MRNSRSLVLVALALLLPICALTPVAYASPPDPSWVCGVYDDADFDDVVILITSVGWAPPAVPVELVFFASPVEPGIQHADDQFPLLAVSTPSPRAPPAL